MGAPLRITAELDQVMRALATMVRTGGGPCKVVDLIEPGSSVAFLQAALGKLRTAGLLEARRGAAGGFWFQRPPEEISVGDVVRALGDAPAAHPAAGDTPVDELWRSLGDEVQSRLDATTIADLAADPVA
jgi:Rrf2 family protein